MLPVPTTWLSCLSCIDVSSFRAVHHFPHCSTAIRAGNCSSPGLYIASCNVKTSIISSVYTAGENEDEYNTDAPLYSRFLANTLNMRTPYEQYGVYLTALGGSAYMANSFFRAYHLAKYVKFKDIPGQQSEAQFAADMARVAPHELDRAGRTIARLKVRGAAAAIASPVLWIAWRLVSQTPTRLHGNKRKDS